MPRYKEIRFNKDIASKIGAFKPIDFKKHNVKPGDYLISCHFGDVIKLTEESFKRLVSWNNRGVYYIKPSAANLKFVKQKYTLQQREKSLRAQLETNDKQQKQFALQIQQSFGTGGVTSDIVLFIHRTQKMTIKQVPVKPGHELLNFGIRYHHDNSKHRYPSADEILYIALIRIPGLISQSDLAEYGGLINRMCKEKSIGYGYAKNLKTTGYKPGDKFKDGMTTTIK